VPSSHDITAILSALRRRMFARAFLRSTARGTLFFYALLVALTAVAWWTGEFRPNPAGLPYMLTWPFVVGALAGVVMAFWQRPTLRQVAETVDALGGTRDRLITALDFSAKERASELEALALRESAAFARSRDFRGLLPVRPPEELRWLVVPLMTLAIFWWGGLREADAREQRVAEAKAATAATTKQLETIAEQLRRRGVDDETARRLAERLKQSAAQVRTEAEQGGEAQKTALRELALLEQLVKELRRPEAPTPDEIKALSEALAKDERTKDAAKDLQQGNLADAAKKLAAAAQDPPTAESAQQALKQALDHLARQKEQLSKQLEQMRQDAEKGGGERQQLMQQLSELLNEMQQNGQLARQQRPQPGNKPGQQQGKQMTDEDLKRLLGALQRMKDQQQGDPGESQPGEGEGEGSPGGVALADFSDKDSKSPGQTDPNLPSGKPGSEKDEGTTASPFGKQGQETDPGKQEQLTGQLAAGESLSALAPSAAKGDAKAMRRYKELTDAAAAAAADAVTQENIPLGARFLIRRYFEAIRPK
jgi:hypothetical protein